MVCVWLKRDNYDLRRGRCAVIEPYTSIRLDVYLERDRSLDFWKFGIVSRAASGGPVVVGASVLLTGVQPPSVEALASSVDKQARAIVDHIARCTLESGHFHKQWVSHGGRVKLYGDV